MYDDTITYGNMTTVVLSPPVSGDVVVKGGPYTYLRRSLPGPGQEADALMDYQWLSFSPIGPSYVNQRQLTLSAPETPGYRTLGIQSPGSMQNLQQLMTQPLLTVNNTNPTFTV